MIIKGTNVGTITDTKGNFTLETTKDAVLSFSFPGMKLKEVAVKDVLGNLKVQLYPDGSIQRTQPTTGTAPTASPKPRTSTDQVFMVVEVMPEFPVDKKLYCNSWQKPLNIR